MIDLAGIQTELQEKLEIMRSGEVVRKAATGTMALMVTRIFEDGLNSSGRKIGQYDNKNEVYLDPNDLPVRISPRGKRGRERKVKDRKTVWFPSYRAMRQEIGRESGFINVRLTNDLQSDFANTVVGGQDVVVNQFQPTRISRQAYAIVLRREINIKKRKGLEERFGPIFTASKDEIQAFEEAARTEVDLLFNA